MIQIITVSKSIAASVCYMYLLKYVIFTVYQNSVKIQ